MDRPAPARTVPWRASKGHQLFTTGHYLALGIIVALIITVAVSLAVLDHRIAKDGEDEDGEDVTRRR